MRGRKQKGEIVKSLASKVSFLWFALFGLGIQAAQAEPGYFWEMAMEVDGMALPMGNTQNTCMPAKGSKTPGFDEKECQLLESRQVNGHHLWKARCGKATATGDFVYQGEAAFKGTVVMEEGGEKNTLKMSAKRLSKCEYTPPKIVTPTMPAGTCDEMAKQLVAGGFFGDGALCTKQRPLLCKQLANVEQDTEQLGRLDTFVQAERKAMAQPQSGKKKPVPVYGMALKECKVDFDTILAQRCQRAVKGMESHFIANHCPAEYKALCSSGRAYTGLCGDSGNEADSGSGGGLFGLGGSASKGKSGGADAVGEGLKQLKGLIGF